MDILGFLWVVVAILGGVRSQTLKKIGILGGGIGGTSAAYFLRRSVERRHPGIRLDMDIFEPRHVGGRLTNIQLGGRLYEAGGSIIHPANLYMKELAKKFSLPHRDTSGLDGRFGLFNGKEFVFTESKWGGLVTALKAFYRYGLDPLYLAWQTRDMINKFSKIYKLQSDGVSFDSVEDLLSGMSPEFPDQLSLELNDSLTGRGFSRRFLDEFVSTAVLMNYGQNSSVQTFVGNVALAGAESGLWSVNGGNERVPQSLLAHSGAKLEVLKVREVERNPNSGKYSILADDEKNNHQLFIDYDAVIIAFPLIKDRTRVEFRGVEVPKSSYGPFHRTVATFVRGTPRFSNWCSDASDCPTDIMGTGPDWKDFYNSLGLLTPVDYKKGQKLPEGEERVWKVFSDASLTIEQLDKLFIKVKEKKEIPWLAYPEYGGGDVPGSLRFRVSPGLFYVGAVEWGASAMEMSVIGGRNAALLAEKELHGTGRTHTSHKKEEL